MLVCKFLRFREKKIVLSRKLCFFFDKQILSHFIYLGQSTGLVLLLFRDMGLVDYI